MERLEKVFGNEQREVEIAKHILTILRPRQPENPMDLTELIKTAGDGLREIADRHKSPHPVDYNRIFEELRIYGYITDPERCFVTVGSRLVMTESAKRIFDENYTSK